MPEQDRNQMGDGNNGYGQAVSQITKTAIQASQNTAKEAAVKGAKTAINAANIAAQSSTAAAEIAAGTASGGPAGTIISSIWSFRHVLYRILICVCMFLLVIIILISSMPSIIFDNAKEKLTSFMISYEQLANIIVKVADAGYSKALEKVETIIEMGGYDRESSIESLTNYAQTSAGYDVAYILAAYSVSMYQQNSSGDDMKSKLSSYEDEMYPIDTKDKQKVETAPVTYSTYKPVTVTVVTNVIPTGSINGVPQYRYETATQNYYIPEESKISDTSITVTNYEAIEVKTPVYSGNKITGTLTETYYQPNGEITLSPTTQSVKYVECTIQPFDQSVIPKAFNLDLSAEIDDSGKTYEEIISYMATSLKLTLNGHTDDNGQVELPTDAELLSFIERQDCNSTRKHILSTALSLVGKVPYFWGGKSPAGWNDEWNTPKLVTAVGDSSTGTIQPYGLDCSGYTDWVYKTALGITIGAGSWNQWDNSSEISESELLPGDLGFLAEPGSVPVNHVLIYAGKSDDGQQMWVHCSGDTGVVLNSPDYVTKFRRPKNVDFNASVPDKGNPIYTIEVEVTHYCPCPLCCGNDANGITASGKPVQTGMVAMSSHYPFGTQIEINGTMYTVEDRGGNEIENNINRVDIYVPNHETALRLGRYKTTAKIYRIGR